MEMEMDRLGAVLIQYPVSFVTSSYWKCVVVDPCNLKLAQPWAGGC